MRASCAISIVLFACFAAGITASPQKDDPLPIEALMTIETIVSQKISPDGRKLALVTGMRRDVESASPSLAHMSGRLITRLEVIDVHTRRSEIIAPTEAFVSYPSWSPDSTLIAFQVGAGINARVAVWSAATQTVRELAPGLRPRIVDSGGNRADGGEILWSPDGKFLIIPVVSKTNSDRPESHVAEATCKLAVADRYPLDASTPGACVAVYRSSSRAEQSDLTGEEMSDISPREVTYAAFSRDIALIEVATGTVRYLSQGYRPIFYRLSPDGRKLAIGHLIGNRDGSSYRHAHDVIVTDVATGKSVVAASHVLHTSHRTDGSWSPDSRILAFFDTGQGTRRECHLVDVASNRSRRGCSGRATDAEVDLDNPVPLWDPSGERFYFLLRTSNSVWVTDLRDLKSRRLAEFHDTVLYEILTHGDAGTTVVKTADQALVLHAADAENSRDGFHALNTSSGGLRKLYDAPASIMGSVSIDSDARTLSFAQESADTPRQVWVSDLAFTAPRQMSELNQGLRKYAMGQSRLVTWTGPSGQERKGSLLLPSNYVEGKRYPLIVDTYPDRKWRRVVNNFGFERSYIAYNNRQLFASRGYAVFGPEVEARIGTPASDISVGLALGINQVIADGVADPQRIGIMGHSYGAYGALAALTRTDRFKAAIVFGGRSNLIHSYSAMSADGFAQSISWVEDFQGNMGGSVWEFRERFVENSPFFYLDRITTPILVIHGTADRTVPVYFGDEIFASLRRLGKTVEYAKYIDEGHGISGAANTIDFAERVVAWFDRYLKATTERAAEISGAAR